jgi:hypothetical protein
MPTHAPKTEKVSRPTASRNRVGAGGLDAETLIVAVIMFDLHELQAEPPIVDVTRGDAKWREVARSWATGGQLTAQASVGVPVSDRRVGEQCDRASGADVDRFPRREIRV